MRSWSEEGELVQGRRVGLVISGARLRSDREAGMRADSELRANCAKGRSHAFFIRVCRALALQRPEQRLPIKLLRD